MSILYSITSGLEFMFIFRQFIACALAAGVLIASGCATDRRTDISELLKEIDVAELPDEQRGPNAPEQPIGSLPEPPPVEETVSADKGDVSGNLTIQPDCLLKIRVREDASLDGNYHVNEIGAIEFGYIGPIILYDKTEQAAEAKIAEVLKGREFRKASVEVDIIRASYDKVRIRGAVNRPGVVKIGAGDDISLNDLLLRANGLRSTARGARVKVVRKGMRSAVAPSLEGEEYSLVSEEGKPRVPDVSLDNNDDVYVFSTKTEPSVDVGDKEITVLGEVKRQGIYRFTGAEPCTVMHLVFKMGGLPPYADATSVKIIRKDEDGIETEMEVNAREILQDGDPDKDVQLESGDRVVIPARRIHLF